MNTDLTTEEGRRDRVAWFHAAIRHHAAGMGLDETYEGIKALLADERYALGPNCDLLLAALDPKPWMTIGDSGVMAIREQLGVRVLTDMDLIRFHLGEDLDNINVVIATQYGTWLYTNETRKVIAGGLRLYGDVPRRRLSRLLKSLTGIDKDISRWSVVIAGRTGDQWTLTTVFV